jgi:outer membrane lipoprotein-sorting protein
MAQDPSQPGRDQDDADLRPLFRATAPSARPVDVDALFAAARTAGPAPRLIRRVFGASPEKSVWKRSLSMSLRIAAGMLIAGGVAAVATLLIPRESSANVTLAEVQATVGRTRTLTCTMTDQRSAPDKNESELHRLLTLGPSLVRIENADRTYTITDFEHRKSLLVDPRHKSARILEGMAGPTNLQAFDFYRLFRTIAADPLKTLPPREIAGKPAVGFVVRHPLLGGDLPKTDGPAPEVTVWVDPQTKLPLRIEMTAREGSVTVSEVFSEIAFDRPLDPALFDLNPPAGYRVETFGVAQLRPKPAAQEAAELVVTPLEGIGPVEFGMKADEVIERLGPPDKLDESVKDRSLLEYYSRGFSIHAHARRGVLMIMCYTGKIFAFKVRDFAGRTDKGIRMGAGRAAIEKAYGRPSSVRGATPGDRLGGRTAKPDEKIGQVDLSYDALRLSFSLHDDALDSIILLAPRPAAAVPARPKEAGAAAKP